MANKKYSTPTGSFVWLKGVGGAIVAEKWPDDALGKPMPEAKGQQPFIRQHKLDAEQWKLSIDELTKLYPKPEV
jgi:hypothetical protein